VTDVPLPPKGSTNWLGWATEQEELTDAAREIVSGRLTDAALRAAFVRYAPTASITRDAAGRISSVTQDGVVEVYSRDTNGRVTAVTRGGVTRTVARDAAGRVQGVS
jgi:YD repeat-containing protein